MTPAKLARYAWAAPSSALGLLLAAAFYAGGAQARVVRGVLEVGGGRLGRLAGRMPPAVRFSALTLGHVILGLDHSSLDACRRHEHVHVRQYERYGPFFLPLYAASSLWQWLRGRHPYLDNHFERQAFREAR